MALVNSRANTRKKYRLRDIGQTEPSLVALYDIRPGNGAGLFLQPHSPHGAVDWGGEKRRVETDAADDRWSETACDATAYYRGYDSAPTVYFTRLISKNFAGPATLTDLCALLDAILVAEDAEQVN